MKSKMENLLPAALALLILADLAFHGVTELVAAPSMPRGVHVQSPTLEPELVRKTKEETDRVIRRGEDRQLGTSGQNCNM